MAKKKKNKPALRTKKTIGSNNFINEEIDDKKDSFQLSCIKIYEFLKGFQQKDVLTALNTSDLWLPNRSSLVKHSLAFSIFVSIPEHEFTQTHIDTYEKFSEFCSLLKELYPNLTMLEDYMPEKDWGDVKIIINNNLQVSILHGGLVQRIVDYVEAFRISNADNEQAINDLLCAIYLQDSLLSFVPQNCIDDYEDVSLGHLEVPAYHFWEKMKSALTELSKVKKYRSHYIVEMGKCTNWKNANEFINELMTGRLLPWQAVKIDGAQYPISIRNTITVVIDTYDDVNSTSSNSIADHLTTYIAKRTREQSCMNGPFMLRSRSEIAPLPISVFLMADPTFFIVVPISQDKLGHANNVLTAMRRILKDPDWGFQLIGTNGGYKPKNIKGDSIDVSSIKIILINTKVSTLATTIENPEVNAILFTIVDACAIFDSLESVEELARFLKYKNEIDFFEGTCFSDSVDIFASFRDLNAQIIDGASIPSYVSLDPHWGANWRYRQLQKFWNGAPLAFPDDKSTWEVRESESKSSLKFVTSKKSFKAAWSSVIGVTTINFVLDAELVVLNQEDAKILEIFAHCAADSLAQRASIIESYLELNLHQINLHLTCENSLLATSQKDVLKQAVLRPIITNYEEEAGSNENTLQVLVTVNLTRTAQSLNMARDASFEAACAIEVIDQIFKSIHKPVPPALRASLVNTANQKPRFYLEKMKRMVDVPDFTSAQVPSAEDYKIARRQLAKILMGLNISPGKYELDIAKPVINKARDTYREFVQNQIKKLDHDSLLLYCVKQYDALIASYDKDLTRIKQSLKHDVDYDREDLMSKYQKEYLRESQNFRYLLESAVVITQANSIKISAQEILTIQAMVDWLLVLYSASDILHNGIYVGGITIDDNFIPEVFYSEKRNLQQAQFGREMATLRLGLNVIEDDKLNTSLSLNAYTELLDVAFNKDLKFTYTNLIHIFHTLIQCFSNGCVSDLDCGYRSSKNKIAEIAINNFPDLSLESALSVIEFLILKPDQAWYLFGLDIVTEDVPVWEHSKRGSRYTIRPLIELPNGQVTWGAAAADQALRIWLGSISNGYLPADFPWPAVQLAVGKLKKELEVDLENRAHKICSRIMPYAAKGIDFKRRFPKQQFPDVGDFDVLAYAPDRNVWLTVECKYNQPAFTPKDTRRLRDRIFSNKSTKSHIYKIERRREFITQNLDLIRTLMNWPSPADKKLNLIELYVSKDMHYWLRFPPYEVPTNFVQIDTLDTWLRTEIKNIDT